MTMIYKTGEEAKAGDSVLGEADGVPLRGRVVALKAEAVVVASRAPYHHDASVRLSQGAGGSPRFVQKDFKAEALSLVYRHEPAAAAESPAVKRGRKK